MKLGSAGCLGPGHKCLCIAALRMLTSRMKKHLRRREQRLCQNRTKRDNKAQFSCFWLLLGGCEDL